MSIRNFTELNAWKEGHQLVLEVYTLTRSFPKEELFALVNQIRRCVVSITSNIAEGFSRHSSKEKLNFFAIALGSSTELENQLIISRDLGYISSQEYANVIQRLTTVQKLLSGLRKTVQSRSF